MLSLVLSWLTLQTVSGEFLYTWKCNSTTAVCTRQLTGKDDSFTPQAKCKLECISTLSLASADDHGRLSTRVLWPRPLQVLQNSGQTSVVDVTDLTYHGNIRNSLGAEELEALVEELKEKYSSSAGSGDIKLSFSFDVEDGVLKELSDSTDESYELTISTDVANGVKVVVKANTYFGARHGVETLSQLALIDSLDKKTYILNGVKVVDKPYYPWRGLSLDTSRNYISLDVIKKLIDGLAAAKMNTLHWHLTDSQSFPFVSSRVPEMSQYGAYLPDKVYSPDTVADIVQHARKRGIRVVPELDAPAHVGYGWQWGNTTGKGDLVVCLGKEPWTEYCLEPPCGQMNVANPELYPVLQNIYKDLKDSFPSDWVHMGGDEVNFNCWKSVKSITDSMESDGLSINEEGFMSLWVSYQQKAYNQLIEARFEEKPKAILWSSKMTEGDEQLDLLNKENYVIQFWGTTKGSGSEQKKHRNQLKKLLEKGFRVIMSNHNELYLDCGFGAWVGAGPNNWCSPFKSWHQAYMSDIREWIKEEGLDISEVKAKELVLGGETAMWTEQTSDSDILYKVFPRTWAYAERLWTNPSKGEPGELGSWQEAEERLSHFASLMKSENRDIPSNTMKPEYCLQNDGKCVLEPSSSLKPAIGPLLMVLIVLINYSLLT